MLGQLLLDRAAALHAVRFIGEIFAQGAGNALVIDRAVLIKPVVLRRHDGIAHRLGNLLGREHNAVLDKNAAQFLAVDVVERGGDVEVVELLQVVGLGARVVNQRLFVGEIAENAAGDDHNDERDLHADPELAPEGALLFASAAGTTVRPCRPGGLRPAGEPPQPFGAGGERFDVFGHKAVQKSFGPQIVYSAGWLAGAVKGKTVPPSLHAAYRRDWRGRKEVRCVWPQVLIPQPVLAVSAPKNA